MPRTASFYEAVLRSLATEGYPDRAILRSFAPVEAEGCTEVLMVAHKHYAETCWTDPEGLLVHGPIPGFGPLPNV